MKWNPTSDTGVRADPTRADGTAEVHGLAVFFDDVLCPLPRLGRNLGDLVASELVSWVTPTRPLAQLEESQSELVASRTFDDQPERFECL